MQIARNLKNVGMSKRTLRRLADEIIGTLAPVPNKDPVKLEARRRQRSNRTYNRSRPRHLHKTTNMKKLRRQVRSEMKRRQH